MKRERERFGERISLAEFRSEETLEVKQERLALAVHGGVEGRKITMLDAVAKPSRKANVVALGRILVPPELIAAFLEFPVFEFAIDPNVSEGFAGFPAIPWPLSPLVEDGVEQGCQGDGHEDQIVRRPKGRARLVVDLNGTERGSAGFLQMSACRLC